MKKTLASIKRPPLKHRPWLNSTQYDRLVRKDVLHVDILAHEYQGSTVFNILYAWAGRSLIASDWFAVHDGTLVRAALDPALIGRGVVWTRRNHDTLRGVHRTLRDYARDMAATVHPARVTLHCHYVPNPDWPAFGRGMVNGYKVRARRSRNGVVMPGERSTELALARVRGTLPDVL